MTFVSLNSRWEVLFSKETSWRSTQSPPVCTFNRPVNRKGILTHTYTHSFNANNIAHIDLISNVVVALTFVCFVVCCSCCFKHHRHCIYYAMKVVNSNTHLILYTLYELVVAKWVRFTKLKRIQLAFHHYVDSCCDDSVFEQTTQIYQQMCLSMPCIISFSIYVCDDHYVASIWLTNLNILSKIGKSSSNDQCGERFLFNRSHKHK